MTEFLLDEATEADNYDGRLLIDAASKAQLSSLDIQLLNEEKQSVLPLGKALHMLLHVKTHVLATAIEQTWKKSKHPPTILTASHVVKALISLDLYLTEHSDNSFLRHIYDPLKGKILKPRAGDKEATSNSLQLLAGLALWSPHRTRYQQWIEQELTQTDKRGALSSVLILSFITKQWRLLGNEDDDKGSSLDSSQMEQLDVMTRYISPLMTTLEQYGELPTLLACTTYDTLLTISVYMVDSYLSPVDNLADQEYGTETPSNPNISMIQDEKVDRVDGDRLKLIQEVWPRLNLMLVTVKKWQQQTDLITNSAWNELNAFMLQAHDVLLGTRFDGYQQVRKSWCWLSKVLVSSQILSKNPTKKMGFIWKIEDKCLEPNLSSYLKVVMLALRQNGSWFEHQITKSKRTLSGPTDEEQLFENQTKVCCRSMIERYPMLEPWTGLNQTMIPTIMTAAPYLCLPCHISLPVYSLLLDFPWNHTADLSNLADCFLSHPLDAIPLLVSRIQPDNCAEAANVGQQEQVISNLSCDIVDAMISKTSTPSSSSPTDPSLLFEQLAGELLTCVFFSNRSCELFLRCLPFIRKSTLLVYLIKKLISAENERTNHVAKGLIAKILLVDSWCGDSILVYIDLVREYLRTRRHHSTFKHMTMAKSATPDDVYHMYDDNGKGREEENDEAHLGNEVLGNVELELLWPIQLWSTKVDSAILERLIPLLINKYCITPSESIFIHVWQMLAHAITQQKSLILAITTKITQVMENQKSLFEMIRLGTMRADDIDFFTLLLPILILRIFPRKAYEHIGLPSSIIQKWSELWPHGDGGRRCKVMVMESNESELYTRLANELLLRYDYSGQIDGIQQIQKLTLDTLDKIFYHQ